MLLFALVLHGTSKLSASVDGKTIFNGNDLAGIIRQSGQKTETVTRLEILSGSLTVDDITTLAKMSGLTSFIVSNQTTWVTDIAKVKGTFLNLTYVEINCDIEMWSTTIFAGCSCITTFICPHLKSFYEGIPRMLAGIGCEKLQFDNLVSISAEETFIGSSVKEFIAPKLTVIGNLTFANSGLTTFSGPSVTKLGNRVFAQCSSLKTVDLPNVVEIGQECFYYTSITSFNGPKVESIGNRVFLESRELLEATMDKVTVLPERCFCTCIRLSKIVVPNVAHLEYGAFQLCFALTKFENNKIDVIGDYGFDLCVCLENVSLTASVIGEYAFRGCIILESIHLPNVEVLKDWSLSGCAKAVKMVITTNVTIGSNVFTEQVALVNCSLKNAVSIGSGCFDKCTALKHLELDSLKNVIAKAFMNLQIPELTLPSCVTLGDEVFLHANVTRLCLPMLTSTGNSPFDYASIGELEAPLWRDAGADTFYDITELKILYLPALEMTGTCFIKFDSVQCCLEDIQLPNLREVESDTFYGLTIKVLNLSSLVKCNSRLISYCEFDELILTKLESLGSNALTRSGIKNITLPSATQFGPESFSENDYFVEGHFPKMTSIANGLFYHCQKLKIVDIPIVQTIHNEAFAHCSSLTSINFTTAESIGESCFLGCRAIEEVSLPAASQFVGKAVFQDCACLKAVNLPNALDICTSMFYNCRNLSSVYIPKARNIRADAFYFCTSLKTAVFGSVEALYDRVFANCDALEVASLDSCVNIYGSGQFMNCVALKDVAVPVLTEVTNQMFINCIGLVNVTAPLLKRIESQAFYNCRSLQTVNFTYVGSINNQAFGYCSALEIAVFPYLTHLYGDGHFEECISLTGVDMRKLQSVNSTASSIFANCSQLSIIMLPAEAPSFAPDIFTMTGKIPQPDGTIAITMCLPDEKSYENYGPGVWNGISTVVPDGFRDTCDSVVMDPSATEEDNRTLIIALSAGGSVFLVAIIVVGCILYRYNKHRWQIAKESREAIRLTEGIIDDFG